jgi:hypothetical protein
MGMPSTGHAGALTPPTTGLLAQIRYPIASDAIAGVSSSPAPTSPATAATSSPENPSAGEVYLVELGILLAMSSDA